MANKTINDYPESTSPNGNWYVLVDDGTGCYKKVKLSNLPGGGPTPSTTTSTSSSTSSSSTSSSTSSSSTSTSSTSSSSTSSSSTSSTSTTACVYVITDSDAQAFVTAAGITNCTQKQAIDTLVIGLKADSLWTSLRAVYPFVGGTATTHKFNLKNPADTDVAFRMTFTGGVTHNANGVTFNGTTGYSDTKFAIEDFASNTNLSYGFYNRSVYNLSYSGGTGDMGVYGLGAQAAIYGYLHRFYPAGFGQDWNTNIPKLNPSEGQNYGFIAGTIRSGSEAEVYRNGISALTQTTFINNNLPSNGSSWFLGCVNDNAGAPSAGDFTNYNYAFAYLGDALSDAQMTNLYNRVQTFQTALGRQVS